MGYLQTLDGDFLRTPQYTSAVTYNKEFATIRDLELDGNIEQNGYWIRPVETTYKGATGYVPIYLNVQGDEETGYNASATGIITEPIMSDLAYDISFGLGARWDIYSDDYIEMVNKIGEEFANIPTVIVNDTRYVIDTLVEWINNYITEKYGDIPPEVKYYKTQKVYPEGQGTLVNWDNSKISEILAASQYNEEISTQLEPNVLYEIMQNLSETDEYLKDILTYPNVRIITFNPRYPGDTTIAINGYSLANNDIVTTTISGNNQTYGVRVTHVKGALYGGEGTISKIEQWETDENQGIVLYNYGNFGGYSKSGLPNYGVLRTGVAIDTIGCVGNIKPYDVLPVGGLWTKQPNNTYKVGYPDPEDDEDQYPVRNGDPVPINIIFRPHFIIGLPSIPEPDPPRPVPWDNETPEDNPSGLYNVFHLQSDASLSLLNGELWNENAIEQIKKTFTNNPLDAIISLHEVYYTPSGLSQSNKGRVVLGFYETDMYEEVVPHRYEKITYQGIPVNKQFENIRDFQRDLVVYLPFIGYRQLDITDICGSVAYSTIYIEYTIDNLTGDCVAVIYVNKDGNIDRKPLYMFNGNCASQLPLTGADRSGLLSASLSAIGGVASTILTGGATAPSLIGSAVSVANNMGASIQRSGNITGNHGAMSFKKPFLIINYPIPFDAENFAHYGGGSSNVTTTLKYCQGFTKMSECIIDSIPCTSQEKASIQSMLASGIII
jgi:hypothetical protein